MTECACQSHEAMRPTEPDAQVQSMLGFERLPRSVRASLAGGVMLFALSACDAFSETAGQSSGNGEVSGASGAASGSGGTDGGIGFSGSGTIIASGSGSFPTIPTIPTDSGEVVRARRTPPPITGGTLLAASGGQWVVVADPDRDRISIANLPGMYLEAIIDLEAGAQPGRLAEDAAKRVHAVLRGTGEVATLDLETKSLVERRAVCASPRGIAFDANTDSLLVACAEGKLVELPASGGKIARITEIDVDVRDVVFSEERVRLTRFRSAQILELSPQRAVTRRQALPLVSELLRFELEALQFTPNLAWRAAPGPEGSTVVVHQRALSDELDLELIEESETELPAFHRSSQDEDVGSAQSPIVIPTDNRRSAYGGNGDGCGGIVHSAVSIMDADGTIVTSRQLAGLVLPVDIAVSPLGTVFVVSAGVVDPGALRGTSFAYAAYSLSDLRAAPRTTGETLQGDPSETCVRPKLGEFGSPAIAVAYEPASGAFLIQTRQPAELIVMEPFGSHTPSRRLSLGGENIEDTGHDLFNRDAGGGVACASCHPEGTEDGHTWRFSDTGPRRTQPLNVGLRGTAPFHWDGSLADMSALMGEVFSRRMGGFLQSAARVQAIDDFIATFRPPAPPRSPMDEAAVRGKALFESATVGCAVCHSGARLSDNTTVDIGKGDSPMQTPSLLGVAHRAPFMHDGCAETLRDRFEPKCGGTRHGNVESLSTAELDDLIAYLESL